MALPKQQAGIGFDLELSLHLQNAEGLPLVFSGPETFRLEIGRVGQPLVLNALLLVGQQNPARLDVSVPAAQINFAPGVYTATLVRTDAGRDDWGRWDVLFLAQHEYFPDAAPSALNVRGRGNISVKGGPGGAYLYADGAGGTVFATRATFEQAIISDQYTQFTLQGRTVAGVGGGPYRRLSAAPNPIMEYHVKSRNDVWAELYTFENSPEMHASFADFVAYPHSFGHMIDRLVDVPANATITKTVRRLAGGEFRTANGVELTLNEPVFADLNDRVYNISLGGKFKILRGSGGKISPEQFGADPALADNQPFAQACCDAVKQDYSVIVSSQYDLLTNPRCKIEQVSPARLTILSSLVVWSKTDYSFTHPVSGGFYIPSMAAPDTSIILSTATIQTGAYASFIHFHGGSIESDLPLSPAVRPTHSCINCSFEDMTVLAAFGMIFDVYCQKVKWTDNYFTGRKEQSLMFYGNDCEVEGNDFEGTVGTAFPNLAIMQCGSPALNQASKNIFRDNLIEGINIPNKPAMSFIRTDWSRNENPWLEFVFRTNPDDAGTTTVRAGPFIVYDRAISSKLITPRITDDSTLPTIKLTDSTLHVDFVKANVLSGVDGYFDSTNSEVTIEEVEGQSQMSFPMWKSGLRVDRLSMRSRPNVDRTVRTERLQPSGGILRNTVFAASQKAANKFIPASWFQTGSPSDPVTYVPSKYAEGGRGLKVTFPADVPGGFCYFTQSVAVPAERVGLPISVMVVAEIVGGDTTTLISPRIATSSSVNTGRVLAGKGLRAVHDVSRLAAPATVSVGFLIFNPKANHDYIIHYCDAYYGADMQMSAPPVGGRVMLDGVGSPEGEIDAPLYSRYTDLTTGLDWLKLSAQGTLTGWRVEKHFIEGSITAVDFPIIPALSSVALAPIARSGFSVGMPMAAEFQFYDADVRVVARCSSTNFITLRAYNDSATTAIDVPSQTVNLRAFPL